MALLQVKVDDDQMTQLKHVAVDKGVTVSDIIRPLIGLFLLEEASK